ncbi:apical junction component 1 homolog [Polypterus senegalus]
MTRTDPPDILVSTVYRDITVRPSSTHAKPCSPSRPCDSRNASTLEDNQETFNKRHCRSFDFLESLDDLRASGASMEYPYWRADRQTLNPEVAWNALSQQGHLRFSSPDLLNSRVPLPPAPADAHHAAGEEKKRTRSRSAPRVKTAFTPVAIEVSPPTVRRGREAQRVTREAHRRAEASPHREALYAASRAMMNEVHPIKLQPQRGESSRYSPLFVPDCLLQSHPEKPATSPHVRCRVDIKPDEAVLYHAGKNSRSSSLKADVPWQRYSSGGSRGLTVPPGLQAPSSRTPTPTDSYSGDYKQLYPLSSEGFPPADVFLQQVPSSRDERDYAGREQRAYSSSSVPTSFFYTEDTGRHTTPAIAVGSIYSEDHPTYAKVDQSARWVHTLPPRSYYTDEPNRYPVQSSYAKPYSAGDPFIVQTAPSRMYYGDPLQSYPVQSVPSRIFYTNEHIATPPEHHVPSRAYYTEQRAAYHRPQIPQLHFNDWYAPDLPGYATHHPTSQLRVQRPRPDASLPTWYTSSGTDHHRLGTDTRYYSKSWDNILNPTVQREQPVHRGRSYENLLSHGTRALSPDERRQPVVVNLSSSPRRYAALSLSENSLLEKVCTDGSRNGGSRLWFVTPEITITDNDLHPSGSGKSHLNSAHWDRPNKGPTQNAPHQNVPSSVPDSAKDGQPARNSSLQQSLEQLDELLADLVIDYKPPASRRPSEDLLGQLKKLIDEEEVDPSRQQEAKAEQEPVPLKVQPAPAKLCPPESSCDGPLKTPEECSPDQSTDEDDTMMCSNSKCRRTESLFNACLYFKSCHSCYTYYCSRNCRREDWDTHKESCVYGRIGSVCRHMLKFCRENGEVHKAFSRIAKVGFLSRGRGVLFLGFPNPGSADNFLQFGLESLLMSPTYLSLRELDSYKDNLGNYGKELQDAGKEYDPNECFLLNVSIAIGEKVPDGPSPRVQAPTVRKYAKVALASSSPEKKIFKKESEMETLILTPPPGMADIDQDGEEGRKAREICFINIQRELRTRGVFLRHEYPDIYQQLCDFVESNKRFTPTTIYPLDKRTGKQFMCMIMAASEPRTLDWVAAPNLLDDII